MMMHISKVPSQLLVNSEHRSSVLLMMIYFDGFPKGIVFIPKQSLLPTQNVELRNDATCCIKINFLRTEEFYIKFCLNKSCCSISSCLIVGKEKPYFHFDI